MTWTSTRRACPRPASAPSAAPPTAALLTAYGNPYRYRLGLASVATGTLACSGPLNDSAGMPTAVNIVGGGVCFTGVSKTYTGPTTVNSGVLQVNGALTASPVTVNAGGALEGAGNIANTVTVASGGSIMPEPAGSGSAGGLSTGSVLLPSGANYDVQLGAAGQYGPLNVTGTATLGGNLCLSALNNFVPAVGQQFVIIQTTGGVIGAFAQCNGVAIQNNTITLGSTTYAIGYDVSDSGDYDVTLTAQSESAAAQFVVTVRPVPSSPAQPSASS